MGRIKSFLTIKNKAMNTTQNPPKEGATGAKEELPLSASLENLREEFELQAKQEGQRRFPVTEQEYRAAVHLPVQNAVQQLISRNQKKYLPVSGMVYMKFIETETDKKVRLISNAINDDEDEIRKLKALLRQLAKYRRYRFISRVLTAGLVIMSLGEGIVSYQAFRNASLNPMASVVALITVALAVGFGAHLSGVFIRKAKTTRKQFLRLVLVYSPAILLFYFIAVLRASVYNRATHFAHSADDMVVTGGSNVSPLAIMVISAVLYLVAVVASAMLVPTEEQLLMEQEYQDARKKLVY